MAGTMRGAPPGHASPPSRPSATHSSWNGASLASDHLAFWVFFIGQCLITASVLSKAETRAAKLQPALVAVLTCIGLLVSTLTPRFYWRHR